jgi:dTDP-4-dehydrorhamnose reductase
MRVLIIGATGMLGHVVFDVARRARDLDVRAGVRRADDLTCARLGADAGRVLTCDVADPAAIDAAFRDRPEVVVNCAGIIKQLDAAGDPPAAITVNALVPHLLAERCDRSGARLIQLSTDCVFSGVRGAYAEDDPPDPVDLYGRTKLLGEVTRAPHLTLRTSIVGFEPFRARSVALLGWFLAQQGDVRGFTRARWSGLTTLALAHLVLELIRRPEVHGLLHVCGETVSKYDLLCLAQRVFGKTDVVVHPDPTLACDRSMRSRRMAALGFRPPGLAAMLAALRDYVAERGERPAA